MRRLKLLKVYFVFWLFLSFIVYSNFEAAKTYFLATIQFNVVILALLSVGVIIVMRGALKLIMLMGTFATLAYKKGDSLKKYLVGIEKILPYSVATMLRNRANKGEMFISSQERTDILDIIEVNFANTKLYVTFFSSTALMIGLLGTFAGLLLAIDQMGGIVMSLSGDINIAEVISSFAGPLGGMAVGFGSSLFGVITAIILGFQGYILERNQATFLEDVGDWLKAIVVDIGSSGITSTGSSVSENGFVDIFVEHLGTMSKGFENFEKSNIELSEVISNSLAQTSQANEDETTILESVSNSLKELNMNNYNTSSMMENKLSEMIDLLIVNNEKINSVMDRIK